MDNKKSIAAVLVILIFVLVGVLALKSFYEPASQPGLFNSSATSLVNSVAEQDIRDEQRIKDIAYLSKQIEAYTNTELGGLIFVAVEEQNISDENSPIFLTLKNYGYLDKVLQDPQADKYHYSYRTEGSAYELRAVLENKNSGKCEIKGGLCLYLVKKEIVPLSVEGN
jgi:hypothetical protein